MEEEYIPEPFEQAEPQPAKKTNTTIIIVIVVVLLLLCCCCTGLGAFFWGYGDQMMSDFGSLASTFIVA